MVKTNSHFLKCRKHSPRSLETHYKSFLHNITWTLSQDYKNFFFSCHTLINMIKRFYLHCYSLSKCLKYPGFIFLCPKKVSKKNPRKKNKVLELSKYYPRIFFWIWIWFFLCPKNYPGKKTNTLNYPNSIRYFGDLAKFSRILHENIIFYHLWFCFEKNWQCLTLCSSQSKRLIIARCKIKCLDEILCSWSI